MKKIRLAAFFLILAILFCISEQMYIEKMNMTLINDINKIDDNLSQNKKIDISNFKNDYQRFKPVLKIICDNDKVDEIDARIIEIEYLEPTEQKMALTNVRATVEKIYESQKLNLSNIL